jgi:hypothetical protein
MDALIKESRWIALTAGISYDSALAIVNCNLSYLQDEYHPG